MNNKFVRFALAINLMTNFACSKDVDASPEDRKYPLDRPVTDVDYTVNKLREYCAACHAVGKMRFIHSDNNQYVWNYIFTNNAPTSGKKWADAIFQVLDWPSDVAPPFDQLMIPPNQDWMPKGSKRSGFAADKIGDKSVRRFILESLVEGN